MLAWDPGPLSQASRSVMSGQRVSLPLVQLTGNIAINAKAAHGRWQCLMLELWEMPPANE